MMFEAFMKRLDVVRFVDDLLKIVELTLLAWGRASLAPLLVNNIGMPLEPGLP